MYPGLSQNSYSASQMSNPSYPVARRGAKRARSSPSARAATKKFVPSTVPRMVTVKNSPLPLRLMNTVKYVEELQVATDATGFGYHQISANGLYDPNLALGGHQPMYFDQLTALYNHYHVMKSKIKITAIRTGTNSNCIMVLYLDDDTVVNATNAETMAERPGAKLVSCWPATGNLGKLTATFDAKAMFGGDIYDNDTLKGTSSANPSEQSVWTIGFNANTSSNVDFLVEIEYTVVWSELKTIAGS